MTLGNDQIRRYARHVLLDDVGGIGQQCWLAASVVLERLDAGGQAAALYLAAAGVGTLVVRDAGSVEAPGPLFEVSDVGQPRRAAAAARIAAMTPDVRVVAEGVGLLVAPAADDDSPHAALAAGAAAAREALRKLVQP
jgi:adenylyltransferase/sulfurtransferase